MLQIIDDDNEQRPDIRPDLFPIELLLDYFIHKTSCRNNFEFIQAVIRLFLKVWDLSLFLLCYCYFLVLTINVVFFIIMFKVRSNIHA